MYTFINRKTGDALRISLNSSVNLEHLDPTWSQLRKKVTSGSATSNEQQDFSKRADIIAEKLMNMPEEDCLTSSTSKSPMFPKGRAYFGQSRVRSAESWFLSIECD